jgi:hypothetical protein
MNTSYRVSRSLLFVLALFFSLPLAAQDQPANAARKPSAPGATVGFANLADGDVVPPVFTVRFTLSGMDIAPAGTDIPNTGHHHLLIDVAELPDLNQPLPANDHIRHFGKGQTEVELALPEGQHTLQLLLADYAHTPHVPPVMSPKITITVKAPAAP